MSNLSIRPSQPMTLAQQTQKAASKPQLSDLAKKESMAQDSVSIRKGAMPSLKGAGIGALAAGGASAAYFAAEKAIAGPAFIDFSPYITAAAAAGGAVGGLTAANTTDSKAKGALVGAGAGALAGAATGVAFSAKDGDLVIGLASAAIGGVIGAVSGAMGGAAGAMVAEQK